MSDFFQRLRRFPLWAALPLFALAGASLYLFLTLRFASDQTPEGAYLRVAKAVNQEKPAEFFAYLEDAAQHACFTIADYRKRSLALARRSYPPAELAKLEKTYGPLATASEGPDVFAYYAQQEGWVSQLRRDLSGIAKVEIVGERATVQTAKGTRYALRRRPNGIWGMTAFTPTLVEEAERAARDFSLVEKASADYARAASR